jgi:BMFP domain-containing protein YqiC
MNERPKFFDDLAGVAGGALSALAGLREEMASMVRARVDEAVRRPDLVKREEFEAMEELARRAKAQVEALEVRVARLELDKPDINREPDDITG